MEQTPRVSRPVILVLLRHPPYVQPMKSLAASLLLLSTGPAFAMNWEGHDDWMYGFATDYTLEAFIPGARPLPSQDCPVTAENAKKNPYEQIPLPRHNCPSNAGNDQQKAPSRR